MKTTKLIYFGVILIIMCLFANCNSGTANSESHKKQDTSGKKILNNFDFNSGEYSLFLVKIYDSPKEGLHYYTKDKTILNEFKKLWIVDTENYDCEERLWHDHILYFVKNDSIKFKIGIASKTNELYIKDLSKKYCFDSQKYVFSYLDKFQRMYCKKFEFRSVEERDNVISKLDTNCLIVNEMYNTRSLKYKRVKRFKYFLEFDRKKDSSAKLFFDSVKINLRDTIKNIYNTENFFMDNNFGRFIKESKKIYYEVDLYSDKYLYDKFDLYERLDNFSEHPLKVTVFSTKEDFFYD